MSCAWKATSFGARAVGLIVAGAWLACTGAQAVAQTNLIGYWNPIFHEDVD